MNKSNVLYILRLTLTLLLITAVVAVALGAVNHITEDRIAQQTTQKAEDAMRQVLDAETYTKLDVTGHDGIVDAFLAGELGYVVRVAPNGYGGAIDLMVGVDADGSVTGIAIVSHSETASLGANATREDFRAQFVGGSGTLAVDKDGGEIDSLTGATVTSRAVVAGVNTALTFVQEVQG